MLAIVMMVGLAVLADEPSKPRLLFDGKTLDGWKVTDFYRVKELAIGVKDGAIVLPEGFPMSGITTTREDLDVRQRRLGRQHHGPFEPERNGCLGKRDREVLQVCQQQMVSIPGRGFRQDRALLDRRQTGGRSRNSGASVGNPRRVARQPAPRLRDLPLVGLAPRHQDSPSHSRRIETARSSQHERRQGTTLNPISFDES